jgi:hypothetical protein
MMKLLSGCRRVVIPEGLERRQSGLMGEVDSEARDCGRWDGR